MQANTDFIIHGPILSERPTYWNVDLCAWTDNIMEATTFPREILSLPHPVGMEGIMEYDKQGNFLRWYSCTHPYGKPLQ